MKRIVCLLLMLALLCGCARLGLGRQDKGVSFYYRSTDADYFSPLGAMGIEHRTLRDDQTDINAMMKLYLGGPVDPELTSPFPKGMQLLRSEMTAREITLVFDDTLAALSGVGLRLACACIARTVAEYGGYDTVTIRAEHLSLDGEEAVTVQPAELVLEDRSAGQPNALVQLFFADAQGRFLIEEQRSAPVEEKQELPEFILRSLIEGPQTESLNATIPKGTVLLNVSVVDRVCLVNFSAEFLQNRPRNELAERMTVFSVVNSLTQLEDVDSVEILVEGSSVERYYELNLNRELVRDEDMIGPVRSGVGEFDAALFLCLEGDERLTVYPMRVQETAELSRAASVLGALCAFAPRNGYYSPGQGLIELRGVQQNGGSLRIEYTTTERIEDAQRTLLLRSLLATACALPEVNRVELIENGAVLDLSGEAWTPADDWYHEPQQ